MNLIRRAITRLGVYRLRLTLAAQCPVFLQQRHKSGHHYRSAFVPGPNIALSGWTALKNGDMELTMASGAVFYLGATALTRMMLDCGDSCDRYTSRREQASISNFKAR